MRKLRTRHQDFCGLAAACGWFPGLSCSCTFQTEFLWTLVRCGARGCGREGRRRPFSKLTFIRAQDLCINVPSILATCVCSFQMRITTTATTTATRRGTNKFCAVSIEMQLKAEVCLACALWCLAACLPSKLKNETHMAYV